ncbi:MAG: hypothetical protein COA86_03480 [Kangiella sp.]|nr:MAG: hypothetical protein COA86_03480 [Kangiella sp.]
MIYKFPIFSCFLMFLVISYSMEGRGNSPLDEGMDLYKKQLFSEAIKLWKLKARTIGDIESQYMLGRVFMEGEVVEQNLISSFLWFQKAAKQNHAKSQYQLARMYDKGVGTPEDRQKALKWYKVAANNKNIDSQHILGELYRVGTMVPVNLFTSFKWFEKASIQGKADSQYRLGIFYRGGWGVEKDRSKAILWLEKSAEQGVIDAAYVLGQIYLKDFEVENKTDISISWLEKAANKGHKKAQILLGRIYEKNLVTEKAKNIAINWYKKAANIDVNQIVSRHYSCEKLKDDLERFEVPKEIGLVEVVGHLEHGTYEVGKAFKYTLLLFRARQTFYARLLEPESLSGEFYQFGVDLRCVFMIDDIRYNVLRREYFFHIKQNKKLNIQAPIFLADIKTDIGESKAIEISGNHISKQIEK